jgi:MFS family permease
MISFRSAEFNASWVTCALSISMIGFIALPKSIILSPLAYLNGLFAKQYGTNIPMSISYIFGLLFAMGLLFWEINSKQIYMYYLFSISFGISLSITDVVVQSLYGSLFPDELVASFAMYNFGWCVMASVLYGYSYYLCSIVKLYICIGFIVLSIISYAVLQFQLKRESNGKETTTNENK